MATPIAPSSSTTTDRPSPERHHGPDRQVVSGERAGARIIHNLIKPGGGRNGAGPRWRAHPHPGGPFIHQAGHGRDRRRLRGEHSGHYYFRDNFRADSGILAMLVLLTVISDAGRPLSELRPMSSRTRSRGDQPQSRRSGGGHGGRGRWVPRCRVGAARRARGELARPLVQSPPIEHRAGSPAQRRGDHAGRWRSWSTRWSTWWVRDDMAQ